MPNHSTPFEIFAGVKPRGVDQGDDRDVERVTQVDETCCFLGSRDVKRSRKCHWLIGDDSNRPTVHCGKRCDDVLCPEWPDF
jgi:hypothetical protein